MFDKTGWVPDPPSGTGFQRDQRFCSCNPLCCDTAGNYLYGRALPNGAACGGSWCNCKACGY